VSNQPRAFLSYTRVDDEFFGGVITSLRKFLQLGIQVVTGNREFTIFQDVDGIEFGQQWQARLQEAISSAHFLIPVVTPCFFHSDTCRAELRQFLEHEVDVGRDDLILPIYFVTTPLLERKELLLADSLASEINKRQRYDWRELADLPISDPQVKKAVRKLAEKVSTAIARTSLTVAPIPNASVFTKLSEQFRKDRQEPHPFRKVLWVDDNPNNNDLERKAMDAYSISFELAKSTGEALGRLRNEKFDAIISDMARPPDYVAGYTLLEALRSSGDNTPYFIYAGSSDPKHLKEALNRGAQWNTNNPAELITKILGVPGRDSQHDRES
jgi:CheY-like chemotaxis protein